MINHPTQSTLPAWLEQAWLDRYLDRGLTEAECGWFETYLIQRPHLVDALERDNELRDALHAQHRAESPTASDKRSREANATGTVATLSDTAASQPPSSTRSSFLAGPSTVAHASRRRHWLPSFASAASLAMAALLGAAVAGISAIHSPFTKTAAAVSPHRLVYDTLRNEPTHPELDSSIDASTALLIDVAIPPQAQAVIVRFADGSSLPLTVSRDGFASLVASAAELVRQSPLRIDYQLDGSARQRTLDIAGPLQRERLN